MFDVQGAGAVLAKFAIPAIAIARNPAVETLRDEVNPRNQKHPRYELPSWQSQPNARPGVGSGIDAPSRIDGLHQAHRFSDVDLRKAGGHAGVMKVQQLYPAVRVHVPHANHAGTAQVAGAIVKDGKLGHCSPRARRLAGEHAAARKAALFILASNAKAALEPAFEKGRLLASSCIRCERHAVLCCSR